MIWLFLAIVGPDVRASSEPTVVRVDVVTEDGATGLCSGVVIAPHRVLTAAHCVAPGAVGRARVAGVSRVAVDPDFDPQALHLGHDLAVLTTERAYETMARVGEPAEISSLRIVGFGLRDDDSSGVLNEADIAVSSSDDRFFELAASGAAPCLGDSGGAAFAGDELVGIVSYAQGCGAFAKITRLASYRGFIDEQSRGCAAAPSGAWLYVLLAIIAARRSRSI